ncbi:GNAT family N-acetyltransferase [Metabacillus malikii]|uniref:RimJ/RimL family protein N-acetyltransferase n=1 Tax=Metabacillus malikii TaxID=1504265 RepID=A0ABT9ZGA8_9BACI|nr:GNAT family N-acetyltransferase [Metabacillus malikii]MDQ0231302.1 RimJ/RimL family protein N-acetyltransferase [Metabacillus malikii]
MIEILTNRLMIIPCSLDIAKSLIFHRTELNQRSPIEFPHNWPSPYIKSFLPFYIENLEETIEKEYECGLWLIIYYEDKKIIGDIVLQGRPSIDESVQLSYHTNQDLDETIAYEAIDAFIDWLTYQKKVNKVLMECDEKQHDIIALYTRLGLVCKKKEGKVLIWEISKGD